MDTKALALATALRDALRSRSERIVLAESCTAGRVAATLSVLPGISQWLCGSFVVYRVASKANWLDIPLEMLNDPAVGPVSRPVTERLAAAALQHTPEADWALAVTGDIGPGAPPERDGVVFVAVQSRRWSQSQSQQRQLRAACPRDETDVAARLARLEEATCGVLQFAAECLGAEN
ncbi:MAG: CinA family protein [Planctomycetales bacterium]|nr:CinA family protein [Planctomycetales bacterium]